jgi:hypothetical protein
MPNPPKPKVAKRAAEKSVQVLNREIRRLVEILSHEDPCAVLQGLQSLYDLGPFIVESLVSALQRKPAPRYRHLHLFLLAYYRFISLSAVAKACVLTELQDPDPGVKWVARTLLTRINSDLAPRDRGDSANGADEDGSST